VIDLADQVAAACERSLRFALSQQDHGPGQPGLCVVGRLPKQQIQIGQGTRKVMARLTENRTQQ